MPIRLSTHARCSARPAPAALRPCRCSAAGASPQEPAQGRLHLCRPDRRLRLDATATTIGRKAVEASTSATRCKTTYVENVTEGPDAERVIRELAPAGNELIFTTSFGFMNPTIQVAKQFPKVKFEHATGYKRADNVATYNARFYEGRCGMRRDRRPHQSSRASSAISARSRSPRW